MINPVWYILWKLPETHKLPPCFKILKHSANHSLLNLKYSSLENISQLSCIVTCLLYFHAKPFFLDILYGGSANTKSIDLSGIVFKTFKASPKIILCVVFISFFPYDFYEVYSNMDFYILDIWLVFPSLSVSID